MLYPGMHLVDDPLLSMMMQGPVVLGEYPASAAAMAAAVGYGTWSAGWLCEEASGNLAAAFGSPSLTVSGSPTYGVAGPTGDRAVQTTTDVSSQYWSGGDVLNVTATDDVVLAGVSRIDIQPAASRIVYGKRGVATLYYNVQIGTGAGGALSFIVLDGSSNTATSTATNASHIGSWFVWIAAWERGAVNQGRICTILQNGTATNGTATSAAPGSLGTLLNTAGFGIGRVASTTAGFSTAAFWVGVGSNAASGIVANMPTAVSNLKNYLGF